MAAASLRTLFSDYDLETTSYSGRGMGGKECLGVVVDDLGYFVDGIITISFELGESGSGELFEALKEALRDMRHDSLGHGMIVYFPSVPPE